MARTVCMYVHAYVHLVTCFCRVCTDVSKSNMQENLIYEDSRLHKGLCLMHY